MDKTYNPDYRAENEERIKKVINKTMHKLEIADEIHDKTTDDKLKQTLREKNDRRKVALTGMRKDIREDSQDS